ncbi:PTS mannitol-specific transporter subunit IIBC [Natribacillus halophilus]|uniref:PTS system mannitol-specific EIICB component n=1 Tax=Natribacillus halophilus TaxID=549003 RepID=A0A1G8PFP3_9BACI|nr:PTS mannitol-specific transporter subunit IIBC [Natribacillus halophilus]SDI91115.1 PTS system, mannitol-specific IIC component [Natribacillus halophilus]
MSDKKSVRARVQRFGSNLSSMIMPNIGAFIAWGILTAIAVPTEIGMLEAFVDPMVMYLLPLLIAFAGGRMLHDFRGGVVGATAAMGVIVAADIPMFIGAMVMGPLGGYVIKKFDQAIEDKTPTGFEMLVNNFSAGIIGAILALIGSIGIGPVVQGVTAALGAGVDAMIAIGALPLVSIFIEPAKILFLNNAINHGIISPIATSQVAEFGESMLFMLEANPGPGIGILIAFMIFGKGAAKASSYGAGIIQFFGGIHELYFPYVLMKPLLIVALIAGGMSGVFMVTLLEVGLTSVPAPGSIFLILAFASSGSHLGVILAVLVAAAVSFAIAAPILKFDRKGKEENIEEAQTKMEDMKGEKDAISVTAPEQKNYNDISSIIFACDAGMGSSAMGASIMKDRIKKAGIEGVEITNTSISNIPESADLVITHKDLTTRAKEQKPDAIHVSVENFMNSPHYNEIIEGLTSDEQEEEHTSTVEKEINKVVFACDAGMGSSAMGASLLKDKFKKAGLTGIQVSNTAISEIPDDADLVITHKDLTDRAREQKPDAEHMSVDNFLNSPKYGDLVERLQK